MGRLALYFFSALALWMVAEMIAVESKPWLNMIVRTPLLVGYIAMAMRIEHLKPRDFLPHR